ncbi:MAG TPA: alanine racemase [Gemmatimonadaceae bacterium]|nr:alanine racemase [Gemmatimonadaceae bacterium]
MTTLTDLETPAAIVDLDRLERNLDRAAAYARKHKLALRPHVKTHKTAWVAAEQVRRGAAGLTCATPREAEVMSAVSSDILVAYPPVGRDRAERVAALPRDARVIVALDSLEAIENIEHAAAAASRSIGVYVEVDMGMHRVGVRDSRAALNLAKRVQDSASLTYEGLAFYPGHIREPVRAQAGAFEQLNALLRETLSTLDSGGARPPAVSGGSTPTLWHSHLLHGVTEIRPGTYVYNDRTTAEIGACDRDDCAFTVLATVVSTAVEGQAVIDAGTKSLGREPLRGAEGAGGFGALLEHPEVVVKGMSEEHGLLDLSRSSWKPRVGEVVRVIPNHVCIVVHLNDTMHGVRGDRVERSWAVEARGRAPAHAES